MHRRDFIWTSNLAATAFLPQFTQAAELRFFSAEDAKWIDALMAQIIPTDDVAGAREAGCLYYLDKQLGEGLVRYAANYRTGLPEFQKQYPGFLTLSFAEQTKLLETLKSPFFEMLVDHTMQGFYGSPDHGGNRNHASWTMLGIAEHMHEHAK
jgi:gluconate 2-dehydrogenase gamma chain